MKYHMMKGGGDCYPACVASLLDMDEYSEATAPIAECNADLRKFLEKHPEYKDDFFDRVIAPWVLSLGYHVFSIYMDYEHEMHGGFAHGPSDYVGIFSVTNEDMRKLNVQHAIVGRGRIIRDDSKVRVDVTEILHDPCRLDRKYDQIAYVDVFMPIQMSVRVPGEICA